MTTDQSPAITQAPAPDQQAPPWPAQPAADISVGLQAPPLRLDLPTQPADAAAHEGVPPTEQNTQRPDTAQAEPSSAPSPDASTTPSEPDEISTLREQLASYQQKEAQFAAQQQEAQLQAAQSQYANQLLTSLEQQYGLPRETAMALAQQQAAEVASGWRAAITAQTQQTQIRQQANLLARQYSVPADILMQYSQQDMENAARAESRARRLEREIAELRSSVQQPTQQPPMQTLDSNRGAASGNVSDSRFLEQWANYEIPATPENLARAAALQSRLS